MSRSAHLIVAVAFAAAWIPLPAGAGEMKDMLDVAANPRALDTHFGRYGYTPVKSIVCDKSGVIRISLPAATKDIGQTGLYSYVVLAGDFEVSASYEWKAVTPPSGGYGVSCGLAVDTGGNGIMVSLARANLPGKGQGNGYAVTVGTPDKDGGTKYETSHFPTQAKNGRLMLKREGAELACMVAEGSKDPLRALVRIPFTEVTVKQARLFADAGGSPTAVDVRLSQFRLRAEEIVGGFPKRDQPTAIPWWPFAAGFFIIAVIVLLVIRRRQQE